MNAPPHRKWRWARALVMCLPRLRHSWSEWWLAPPVYIGKRRPWRMRRCERCGFEQFDFRG